MDENHIGPNINTIPVRTSVRDGLETACILLGKQCPCSRKVFGSIPRAGNLCAYK